jgi:hypothetical protein
MNRFIGKEKGMHGRRWDSLHQGYFSDPHVAAAFNEKVTEAVADLHPEVIVDLGGGTGFLLSELGRGLMNTGIRLVNMDCSDAQIAIAEGRGIDCLRASAGEFKREYIDHQKKRFLFMMRSVIHYFGREGVVPLLRHIRTQAEAGELFLHQTASFERKREAACSNLLYKKMRTGKWYHTVPEIHGFLKGTGWHIDSVSGAPPLLMTSQDLAVRYGLSERDIAGIRDEVSSQYGDLQDVFRIQAGGFCAYLHYRIYRCRAV